VAEERRRIALDLHDGVGSQLVRILATLESNMPHQHALALTLELEQCLLDLKLTVDRIDGADDSVIDALGRLRYRVQPAMEKLGIRLIWSVDVEGPLQEFKGDPAQEVLCIAQEGLSNVIRHASATVVVLICRYVAASKVMLLEVRDNGRGAAGQFTRELSGKGLEGMRRRARKLGGHVQIAIRTGLGTRIRLSVPFNPTGQETATLDEWPAEQMLG
jgi:signal transduction histidine kinase